ncbi:MAG: hypothetical protein R8K20_11640 [Gallionellaceae bacterium]
MQDIASYQNTQETLALLKRLALGNQAIAEGKITPIPNASRRLHARKSMKNELQGIAHAQRRA